MVRQESGRPTESVKRYRLRPGTDVFELLVNEVLEMDGPPYDTENLGLLVERLVPLQIAEDSKVMPLTPVSRLASDHLAETILPWVELIRVEIIGSADVPFSDSQAAEYWITEQARREPIGSYEAKLKKFEAAMQRKRHLPPMPPFRTLFYLDAEGKMQPAHIYQAAPKGGSLPLKYRAPKRYTPLNWLDNETRAMEKATGFSQLSLVQYILRGIAPLLPRARASYKGHFDELPTGGTLARSHIQFDILTRDLTFDELRWLYMQHRDMLKAKRRKSPDDKGLALYRLAQQIRGPFCGKGSKAAYERLMHEWNSSHPDSTYTDWRGVKAKYQRVVGVLEAQQ